ncbi:MAG: V-type ATP synthase subunit E [Clostridia bacterium]|nr:V-type ATP synthase subunit E [Clostridia bacterium]
MDGLTNIINKIHEQCDAECKNLLASAKSDAEQIISDSKAEADAAVSQIKLKADAECAIIDKKAASSADLEYRRYILAEKSRILDETVKHALEAIKNSDNEVYFGYIEKLLTSGALTGEGVVRMSSFDLNRLPAGFEDRINGLLEKGKSIKISNDASDIDMGFVIEYSEMRVDCTFSSLINDKIDDIKDKLSRALFA